MTKKESGQNAIINIPTGSERAWIAQTAGCVPDMVARVIRGLNDPDDPAGRNPKTEMGRKIVLLHFLLSQSKEGIQELLERNGGTLDIERTYQLQLGKHKEPTSINPFKR